MSKDNNYRQCKLELLVEYGRLIDTAWIPSSLAIIGQKLAIKTNDVWVDGWVVIEVGSIKDNDELLNDRTTQKRFKDVLGK